MDAIQIVFLGATIAILVLYLVIGIFLLSLLSKGHRLVRQALITFTGIPVNTIHIEERVIHRHEDEAKAYERLRKAEEARDHDTIDKAEGYGRDL